MLIERRCRLQSGRPKWAKRPAARPPWVPVNCWPSPALLAAGLLAHLGQKAGRQTPFEFHCTETSSVSGYQLGANNPLARGEQSDPRTAENASQNQSFIQLIGRKRVYPLSPLLGGGFPKDGGTAWRANNNNKQASKQNNNLNSFGIGGGCAASAKVSKWAKITKCQ